MLIEIKRKKRRERDLERQREREIEKEKQANVCCPFQRLFRIFFYFFLGEGIAALRPKWAVRAVTGGCGH